MPGPLARLLVIFIEQQTSKNYITFTIIKGQVALVQLDPNQIQHALHKTNPWGIWHSNKTRGYIVW